MKRTALELKKRIISVLDKRGELSLKALEIAVNTSSQTIQTQIKELQYLGFVEIINHSWNKSTGRPFTSIKLIKKEESQNQRNSKILRKL